MLHPQRRSNTTAQKQTKATKTNSPFVFFVSFCFEPPISGMTRIKDHSTPRRQDGKTAKTLCDFASLREILLVFRQRRRTRRARTPALPGIWTLERLQFSWN